MSKIKNIQPEGLSTEEFDKLSALNRGYSEAKSRVADAALFHKRSVDALDKIEELLRGHQNELATKYGEDKSIDMKTGMFV